MKPDLKTKISAALVGAGVPVDLVDQATSAVWSEVFAPRDRVPSGLVLDALDKAQAAGMFSTYKWLAERVGVGPNYFAFLRYKPGSMGYDKALAACALVGVDLDAVLASAGLGKAV
jgi:hypothetical protein